MSAQAGVVAGGAAPGASGRLPGRLGFWAVLGAALLGMVVAAVRYALPPPREEFGGIVRVSPAEIPLPGDAPKYFRAGKFFLVNLEPGEGANNRITAPPAERGGLLALYARGLSNPCFRPVVWRTDLHINGVTSAFTDPCNFYSAYTKAGIIFYGPGFSLDTMEITVERDGWLAVNTGKMRAGGPGNALRTVPWPPER